MGARGNDYYYGCMIKKINKEIPHISSRGYQFSEKLYDVLKLLNYSNLLDNLKTYDKKYPNAVHPLYSYMRAWKSDTGISIRNYMKDISNLSKTQGD